MKLKLTAVVFLTLPHLVFGADTAKPVVQKEVTHLFHYLKNSGCDFNRNGSWYTAPEAVEHLNKKYTFWVQKEPQGSTEDFIKHAASESSVSGKDYQVRCEKQASIPSSTYLLAELMRYRKSTH